MADAMSGSVIIRYCAVAAAALGVVLSVGAAQANDKAVFRDVLKPRTGAQRERELADGDACGTSAGGTIQVIMPVFEKCMRRQGWALDRYIPDPAARPAYGTNVAYTDTRGNGHAQLRGDAALQSDPQVPGRRRDEESAGFTRCMAARGWRYMYAQHAPARPALRWAGSSAPSGANLDDDVRQIDEQNRIMQENSDAAAAASAALVAAQQAADQQMQNAITSMVVNPQ